MSKGTFVDFYEVFDLDRSMSEKELKKLLGKKSVEVSQLEGSSSDRAFVCSISSLISG